MNGGCSAFTNLSQIYSQVKKDYVTPEYALQWPRIKQTKETLNSKVFHITILFCVYVHDIYIFVWDDR